MTAIGFIALFTDHPELWIQRGWGKYWWAATWEIIDEEEWCVY